MVSFFTFICEMYLILYAVGDDETNFVPNCVRHAKKQSKCFTIIKRKRVDRRRNKGQQKA